jgi:hypothetical protein
MADSFDVAAAALTQHARTLSRLADELRSALDEAGAVNMTPDAYGQTASRFATALDALARLGQETLRDGVEALENETTKVSETAAAYERHDEAEANRLARIGESLDDRNTLTH